jgi:hypothetical protein
VPGDITPDQLRGLLAVCPTFNSAARADADRALAENPDLGDDEYWEIAGTSPDIRFESPRSGQSDHDSEGGASRQEFLLYQLLEEEQNRYLEELNAQQASLAA